MGQNSRILFLSLSLSYFHFINDRTVPNLPEVMTAHTHMHNTLEDYCRYGTLGSSCSINRGVDRGIVAFRTPPPPLLRYFWRVSNYCTRPDRESFFISTTTYYSKLGCKLSQVFLVQKKQTPGTTRGQ